MNLQEWAQIFLKQRDIIKREIAEIKEEEKGFLIITKEGKEKKIIVEEELSTKEANTIICLNTKKNVEKIINMWQELSQKEDLLVVFASPKTNEKWLVKPYHHNKISDKESLKQGLLSMYDAISSA